MKPNKISFNNISVKNQQIKTNVIVKNNIEFLNDKGYIEYCVFYPLEQLS